jgi:nitrous oxidase accessory protein NosD
MAYASFRAGWRLLAVAALAAGGAGAATIDCPDPDHGILTLQHALDAAVDGDVIRLAAGEYRGNFTVSGKERLTITAKGKAKVVIDARPLGATGSGPALVATACPDLRIEKLTLRNAEGIGNAGAGLHVSDSPRFVCERVQAIGNASCGIVVEQSPFARVVDCALFGNAGGLRIGGANAVVKRTSVANDAASGIQIFGDDASILDSRVTTIRGGGGIEISGDRPEVGNCEVSAVLDADTNGITTSGANPDLRGNRVAACDTGMFVVYGAHGTVKNNVIRDCSASGLRFGGVSHTLAVTGNRVIACGRSDAPGFWIDGPDHEFTGNRAEDCAGDGFLLLAANVTLIANHALRNGRDGFDVDAAATGARLIDNVASGNGAEGIENSGTATRLEANVAAKNRLAFGNDGTVIDDGGNDFDVAAAPPPELD